jgi:two-component system sensor histidine kinase DegS
MVMVEDNGVGFDPKRFQRGNQLGLVGMHERVDALSGTLTVESKPGAGTTVVVEVPIAGANSGR